MDENNPKARAKLERTDEKNTNLAFSRTQIIEKTQQKRVF
jgi:hypothetical protein